MHPLRILGSQDGRLHVLGNEPSAAQVLPPITIITVNLNNASGLARTLASVNNQTYANWSHIVQDAASTDQSLPVCYAYADPRRQIFSQADHGIYDGMNRALSRADDGLIWFINSGDVLSNADSLKCVAEALMIDDWAWAVGGLEIQGPQGTRSVHFFDSAATGRGVLLGYTMFPHPATIYRRNFLIELHGFRLEAGISADQDLAVRAYAHSKPKWIPQSLVTFEAGGVSDVGIRRQQLLLRRLRVLNDSLICDSQVADALWTTGRVLYLALKRLVPAWLIERIGTMPWR